MDYLNAINKVEAAKLTKLSNRQKMERKTKKGQIRKTTCPADILPETKHLNYTKSFFFKNLTRTQVDKIKTPKSCTIPVGHYRPNQTSINAKSKGCELNKEKRGVNPFGYISKNSVVSLYEDNNVCGRIYKSYNTVKENVTKRRLEYVPTVLQTDDTTYRADGPISPITTNMSQKSQVNE